MLVLGRHDNSLLRMAIISLVSEAFNAALCAPLITPRNKRETR